MKQAICISNQKGTCRQLYNHCKLENYKQTQDLQNLLLCSTGMCNPTPNIKTHKQSICLNWCYDNYKPYKPNFQPARLRKPHTSKKTKIGSTRIILISRKSQFANQTKP